MKLKPGTHVKYVRPSWFEQPVTSFYSTIVQDLDNGYYLVRENDGSNKFFHEDNLIVVAEPNDLLKTLL